jgi:hypothetical protein
VSVTTFPEVVTPDDFGFEERGLFSRGGGAVALSALSYDDPADRPDDRERVAASFASDDS